MLWLKQLTTSTFSSINKKVDRVEFLNRNKKAIAMIAGFWLISIIVVYLLFDMVADNSTNAFLSDGAVAANNLANQSAPLLLEDDILGLNREVAEFAKSKDVLFSAVLNHEGKVVAHTDAEKFNKLFEPLAEPADLGKIDGVAVTSGRQADDIKAVYFSKDITFSGVVIGSAVYGVPNKNLSGIQSKFRMLKLILFFICTLAAVAAIYLVDKRRRSTPARPAAIPSDDKKIGPYQLRDKIAQGGMAELYIADYIREDGFKRLVAIKKVLPHLAENQDFINMFIREARLAALLQHPNIVQIFDFGKIHNSYFIAMEYIKGLNLGEIMGRTKKALPLDMAVFIIMKISLGLEYSHKRKDDDSGEELGIVHRDISPQNILISHQGEVKISDFGISKATTEPSLTQAGVIKGKLSYLAPEQALGQPVDRQADIYALGLVFYEILTGKRLCQFDSDIEAIRTIPEMVIPPLKSVYPDIPDDVDRIVMKCLDKDKNVRYADAMTLHDDLMQLRIKQKMTYDASDLSNFIQTILNNA